VDVICNKIIFLGSNIVKGVLNYKLFFWFALYYREDFNSLDEFTALRFIEAGVPPAVRRILIL
jgi:hypothetical protein